MTDRADIDAAASPGEGPGGRGHRAERQGSLWRELPVLVLVALVLALLIKTFLVQAFYIPSGSMEDTLQVGDRVLVNKVVYRLHDVRRGDVVVFNGVDSFTPEVTVVEPAGPVRRSLAWLGGLFGFAPPSEKDFIKRVIGVPGDKVECCDDQKRITVNGVPLDETGYLYPGDQPSTVPFSIVVPSGRLWVMGDHRSMSSDSRSHLGEPGGGTVPEGNVIGKAFVVIWPVSDWQLLSTPATFQQPGLAAGAPLALGLAGAVPIVAVRRRRRARRSPLPSTLRSAA